MKRGSVYQRHTRACPRAPDGSIRPHKCHGPWAFHVEAGRLSNGRRRQISRSGFPTKSAALTALRGVLDREDSGLGEAHRLTVADYLDQWLAGKRALRDTTRRAYETHIKLYLRPHLGSQRLVDLRPHHIDRMYAAILGDAERGELKPSTLRRIHATLRSALNTAVKRRLIPWNPALHVELPQDEAYTITVWTPEQVGHFLDTSAGDRLYALYHLVAFTGLRRGEVAGLRWCDVDLDVGYLRVAQQLILLDDQVRFVPPKTRSGVRTVSLDAATVEVLRAHRDSQQAERDEWADGYRDLDLAFAWEDGSPLTPDHIYRRFQRLTRDAGLPPIRLHDLRHTSASLALAAGVPMKVVSDRLGHSSTTITADLYTHVVPAVAREAADLIAGVVPRRQATDESKIPSAFLAQDPQPKRRHGGWKRKSPGQAGRSTGAPPGTRTPNPRIKSPLLCQLS